MSKYVGKIITNQAPAGYSVYFDGSGDSLSIPYNAAFDFGTGDFTIEAWIYLTSPPVTNSNLYGSLTVGGTTVEWFNANQIALGNANVAWRFTSNSVTFPLRSWFHFAVTRASGVAYMWLNGVSIGSGAETNTFNAQSGTVYIGQSTGLFFPGGYISNFRVTKGGGLYTTAFTPPTQLFRTANTSLLTCNSPAIVDQSSNAFAITTNGNAAVSTFTPFAAYNPAPTNANPLTPAPGVWTLDEALQYTQQGVWPSPAANAIEDVFSTYLYTGNGSTQTITNGIDLSGKGGLVWIKSRNTAGLSHSLIDTVRGQNKIVYSNLTNAEATSTAGTGLTSFSSSGFNLGPSYGEGTNSNGVTNVSWTFREQAKFFDVVTFTASAAAAYTFNHNLGSTPGFVIIKPTSVAGAWYCYHTSLGVNKYILLNTADPAGTNPSGNWAATSTTFTVPTDFLSGGTQNYVAYLFANNAGGFGPAGTDNVISCGSFTYSAGTEVNLGYEPQWLVIKRTDITTAGSWYIVDVTRGWTTDSNASWVTANTTDAEISAAIGIAPTATGFRVPTGYGTGSVYIYIAIRRGPMRPPSIGTSVFSPQLQTPTGSGSYVMAANSGFPVDWLPTKRPSNIVDWFSTARLTNNYLSPNTTAAEGAYTYGFDLMQGVSAAWDASSTVSYAFRRAPGFFDVVCYTGDGSPRTITHNLTIPPEFIIVKKRSAAGDFWQVYHIGIGNSNRIFLNSDDAASAATSWNNTTPTASVFSLGTSGAVNASGATFVAYLFATVGGVSKVGSYTGTGADGLQINCGFTNGPRFVLIKRTDSANDWHVFDSARGINAGADPYLKFNTAGVEVTGDDIIDSYASGFIVNAFNGVNANGGKYIFLAIA